MRKKIKATGFSDWDSMFYNNLLSIPVLLVFSFVIEDWGSDSLNRNLYVNSAPLPSACAVLLTRSSFPGQPTGNTWPTPLRYRLFRRRRRWDFIYHSVVHPRDKQHNVQVRVLLGLGDVP